MSVGLAWTAVGGEVLLVEASKMAGEGKILLTGQLGEVMQESAKIAINWMRAHAVRVSSHTISNGQSLQDYIIPQRKRFTYIGLRLMQSTTLTSHSF